MRYALAVALALVSACDSGKKASPPAERGRVDNQLSREPKGTPGDGCPIDVAITPTAVTFRTKKATGDIVRGQIAYKPGDRPNLGSLRTLAASCNAARLALDDALLYQDAVAVMDAMVDVGLTQIAIANGADASGSAGSAVPPDPHADLSHAPRVIVSPTAVLVGDKSIATPDAPDLEAKLVGTLAPNPSDPTLILQADAQTSAAAINHIVLAAKTAGYTNVLFAVGKK